MSGSVPLPAVSLAKDELRQLSRLIPSRGFAVVALQWLIIAAAIAVAKMAASWPATIAAIVVIATRQHALAVLMHDAAHHLLHRNKLVNDLAGNVFLSFPLLISTHRYRVHHLLHHRYLNTEQDPDNAKRIGPGTRRELMWQLLADLAGINALKTLTIISHFGLIGPLFKPADTADGLPLLDKRLAIGFLIATAAVLAASGIWIDALIYWVVPMVTVLTPILHLRALAEHGGCADTHDLNAARTVDAGLIERLLLVPCNVHYHLEHHLYPSIPFYHLPELSERLQAQAVFRDNAHFNKGYFIGRPRVLDEVIPTPGAAPVAAERTPEHTAI